MHVESIRHRNARSWHLIKASVISMQSALMGQRKIFCCPQLKHPEKAAGRRRWAQVGLCHRRLAGGVESTKVKGTACRCWAAIGACRTLTAHLKLRQIHSRRPSAAGCWTIWKCSPPSSQSGRRGHQPYRSTVRAGGAGRKYGDQNGWAVPLRRRLVPSICWTLRRAAVAMRRRTGHGRHHQGSAGQRAPDGSPSRSAFRPKMLVLKRLVNNHGVGIDALALPTCCIFPGAHLVLSRGHQAEHLLSNLRAADVTLSNGEVELNRLKVCRWRDWEEERAAGVELAAYGRTNGSSQETGILCNKKIR